MPLIPLLFVCLLLATPGWAEEPATPPPAPVAAAPADAYQETFILYKTGKSAEAYESIQKILKASPKDARALELQGRILHALGKYDAAVESYLAALDADPQRIECHYLLGEASFAQQYWAEAIQFYGVSLQQSKSPKAAMKLVYCFVAAGDLHQAGKLVSMLDPSSSEGPEYYFAKAALDASMGREPDAQAALQQVRTLYGNATYNQFEPDYLYLRKMLKPAAGKEEPVPAPATK